MRLSVICELFLSFKLVSTLTSVSKLIPLPSDMSLQIRIDGECLLALVTLKFFLCTMPAAHVPCQVAR